MSRLSTAPVHTWFVVVNADRIVLALGPDDWARAKRDEINAAFPQATPCEVVTVASSQRPRVGARV